MRGMIVTKRGWSGRCSSGAPCVPRRAQFTQEAREALVSHFGVEAAAGAVADNRILELGSAVGVLEEIAPDRFRDVFGVVWDRSEDKDIGVIETPALPEPTLDGYSFPDPRDQPPQAPGRGV